MTRWPTSRPIAHVGNAPSIMLVPNSSPAKTVKEWVDYAKKNPGKLNYASSGNGTMVHLTARSYFKAQAGLFLTHIPYRGTALAIPDLVSGKLDLLFDSLPSGLPHVKRRAPACPGHHQRSSARRCCPTCRAWRTRVPGYETVTWFGLYGPKGLPAELATRVSTGINQALQDPEVKDRLARLGIEPWAARPRSLPPWPTPTSAKWKKIITDRKIRCFTE
jgi:tripartite-type tricarboxylate transporter receptor subunit TctC